MKVNTSVQFKDVLKNFPKAYSNAELCKHFASEYGKIVKRVFPNKCFSALATKFRNVYVKKYSSSRNKFLAKATSFLEQSFYVNPDKGKELDSDGEGDVVTPPTTPPALSDVTNERGVEPSPAFSFNGSAYKPFTSLSKSQKYKRLQNFRSKLAHCDKAEKCALLDVLKKDCSGQEGKYSHEQLLRNIAVLDLSVDKYEKFRALTGADKVAHYNTILKYRNSVLPQIQTTVNSCSVTLRDMVKNTVKRLLEYLSKETDLLNDLSDKERHSLFLIAKLGSDGQAEQANYKVSETMLENISDSAAFSVGFVPLFLKTQCGRVLWENPAPNSPYICRNLVFSFEKETDEVTFRHYMSIKNQVAELEDIQLIVNNEEFTLLAAPSTFETTMYDGKSVVAITRNLTGKAIGTQSCQLCFKLPTQFHHASPNEASDNIDSRLTKLGISCLHMWIRCMEYLFNISIRRHIDHKVTMTSAEFKIEKERLQLMFKERMQLEIFKVKHGAGNTNDGNTARQFFNNDETARILNIPLEVLHLFRDLITMLNNPHVLIDEEEYAKKAEQLWSFLTCSQYNFNIAPMSASVHKLLCHGITYNRAFGLPLGMLSESAIEARNKYNKRYRCNFAFQGSLMTNVRDTGVRLLLTSDPYIFMMRYSNDL